MRPRPLLAVAALPFALGACAGGPSEYAPAPTASASESPGAEEGQRLCTVVNESGEIVALDSLPLQDFGRVAIYDELADKTTEGNVSLVRLYDGSEDHRLAVDFPLDNRTRLDKINLRFRIVTADKVTLDVRVGQPCHIGKLGESTQYYTTIVP